MKKGQSLIEYALILALVTIIAITALQLLGGRVNNAVESAGNNMEAGAKNAGETYCAGINKSFDPATNSCK